MAAITLQTATQLEQLATQCEAAPAPSDVIDKQLLTLIRPIAATQSISLPTTAAKYTSTIDTMLKLQPPATGYFGAAQEVWGMYAYKATAVWSKKGTKPGEVVGGGAGGVGQTIPLAMCAATSRTWADIVRSYVAAHP